MANKEKIDYLLLDIRELEKLIAGMRDAEVYPVSFFSQTFDLAHKILKDLHLLENDQIETLKQQMEEHQRLIQSIPASKPTPHPEPTPAPAPAQTGKAPVFLNEVLEKKNLTDFRKALSLNDRFYFRRELFAGDEAKMNKVITDLNDIHSFEDSIAYLNDKLNWNVEDDTVADFIKLLEKRFL